MAGQLEACCHWRRNLWDTITCPKSPSRRLTQKMYSFALVQRRCQRESTQRPALPTPVLQLWVLHALHMGACQSSERWSPPLHKSGRSPHPKKTPKQSRTSTLIKVRHILLHSSWHQLFQFIYFFKEWWASYCSTLFLQIFTFQTATRVNELNDNGLT